MGRYRAYIKPLDTEGNYKDSFIEITEDIDIGKIGTVAQVLDNNEYDVGVLKYSSISISLKNDHGKYSDVSSSYSIFSYKRSNSIFKLTWQAASDPAICGIAISGTSIMAPEQTIYEGLLKDDSNKFDARSQIITFKVLGLESIFNETETNYTSISNGDDISDAIYTLLNQSNITDIITVSAGNISVGIDSAIDDKSSLENTTVKEALDDLLQASNSILWVYDSILYISDRTPEAAVERTFYGPGSTSIENMLALKDIRSGLNKTFNYWNWKDTTINYNDASSVLMYGIKKKTISYEIITNTTKRNNILDNLRTEFSYPKQELVLTIPTTYTNMDLINMDRVAIDYPNIYVASPETEVIPLYGFAIYGTDYYPTGEFSLTISSSINWKVMGRKLDIKNQVIHLNLREI